MKISVIVLTYNSENYVLSTLESAYRQDFDGDIELIVSDDASSDGTVRLCEEWMKKHEDRFIDTILMTSSENTGVTANIDRACRRASGEWLKVIAGDDILMDDCITKLLRTAHGYGDKCCFISAQALVFSEDRELEHPESLAVMDPVADRESIGIDYIFHDPLFWLPAPTFMYRKSLLEHIGYFPSLFRNLEDAPFIAKVLAEGYTIHIAHTPAVYYRVHDKSLTRSELNTMDVCSLYLEIFRRVIRPLLGPIRKWDAFFAYLPLRINVRNKGKLTKAEKKARKYGKYFMFSHFFRTFTRIH